MVYRLYDVSSIVGFYSKAYKQYNYLHQLLVAIQNCINEEFSFLVSVSFPPSGCKSKYKCGFLRHHLKVCMFTVSLTVGRIVTKIKMNITKETKRI